MTKTTDRNIKYPKIPINTHNTKEDCKLAAHFYYGDCTVICTDPDKSR